MAERAEQTVSQRTTPLEQVQRLYEDNEARAAKAMENLVGRDSFGELLAKVAENTMAVVRLSNDALDIMLRNLRIAGRQDIAKLGRQLARTEDKLEQVLQEVERLGEQLAEQQSRRGK